MTPEPSRNLPGSQASLPEALESAVVAAAEKTDDEQDEIVAALCREHPEWAPEIWRALATLRRRTGLAAPAGLLVPVHLEQLGAYHILGRLGQGGAGTVLEAVHVQSRRRVALKTIRWDLLDNEHARLRFRREMITLTRLDHPNICRILEVGEDRGVPFMALDLVDGHDLARVITAARSDAPGRNPCARLPVASDIASRLPVPGIPDEIAIVILTFAKIARAVHAAHSVGVVHRDLKPSNIMITPEGEPVVLDFGLALITDDSSERLSRSGDLLGTLEYMAPEQAHGHGHTADHRVDIHALGVAAFETLSLALPCRGATRQEILDELLHSGDRRNVRQVNPDVPESVSRVIATALAVDPEKRHATADSLATELERCCMPTMRRRNWLLPATVACAIVLLTSTIGLVPGFAILRPAIAADAPSSDSDRVRTRFLARAKQPGARVLLGGVVDDDAVDRHDGNNGSLPYDSASAMVDGVIRAMPLALAHTLELARALRVAAHQILIAGAPTVAAEARQRALRLIQGALGEKHHHSLEVEVEMHDMVERIEEAPLRDLLKRCNSSLGILHIVTRRAQHLLYRTLLAQGEPTEHDELRRQFLASLPPKETAQPAGQLLDQGLSLLRDRNYLEAEPKLRAAVGALGGEGPSEIGRFAMRVLCLETNRSEEATQWR